jgi:predicted HTH transcriptional regulator
MNHLQYEFGLIPSKIVKEDKAEYIQSLVDAREQESLAPYREFMVEEHIRNLTREIESFKKSQLADPIKPSFDPINSSSDPIKDKLYQAIVKDNTLNYAAYAAMIGVSEATVKRRLGELKKAGIITRVGSNKNGYWEIIGKGDEV